MRERPPKPPPERRATARDSIREALLATRETNATATARDLGAAAGISEKDVAQHLEHLARSLKAEGMALEVVAAECLACEFVFRERAKYTAPSACPECRSERVAPPSFRLKAPKTSKAPEAPKPPKGE